MHDRMYPSEVPATAAPAFSSFQHLLPGSDSKNKSQHKQPIKLTLLSKVSMTISVFNIFFTKLLNLHCLFVYMVVKSGN